MIQSFVAATVVGITLVGCANTSNLSGDAYSASAAKQIQSVSYGTLISVRPVNIHGNDDNNLIGTIGGAVLGGFLGNTIGSGTGRSLATAGGAIAGGLAGQGVQGTINKTNGVELEIRKDDGTTIMVVQQQAANRYSVGQRVALALNGTQLTVSPR
ncbi:glycine zipper 2TM domain-containing protein [Pantoea sp. Nvir]|uniref:glycine zipper 2TM domain-containing protein n=1 Tax=Pantoea sp. Nvir TaxID=2576760 RepID=UPI0027FA2DA9|nr:glycine zipper 2TM domain-containing protein [Pantoea sp. Nvir]CAJ0991729.1 Outer membrane lipoprotein SlyB [Pantoea sp. Nvir]